MAFHEHRFNLPADVKAGDAELERVAGRALRHEHVRSVSVDRDRRLAVIRCRQPIVDVDFAEIAACATADFATIDQGASLPAIISWIDPRDGSISFVRMPRRANGWWKALYLLLAAAFLALGLIGVVLPGLPTTPFVLLGSYFLLRSSQRLHQRLMSSRLFGGILRDWHVHRGIRPHVRARAIAVVALVVIASLAIARPPLPIAIGIIALVACGLFVIWRLPNIKASDA